MRAVCIGLLMVLAACNGGSCAGKESGVMDAKELRLSATEGRAPSALSAPFGVLVNGEAQVGFLRYSWRLVDRGHPAHITSPHELVVIHPSTRAKSTQDLGPTRDLGAVKPHREGIDDREAAERNLDDAFDALFMVFVNASLQPPPDELARRYRVLFTASQPSALMDHYLRNGHDWFAWLGMTTDSPSGGSEGDER